MEILTLNDYKEYKNINSDKHDDELVKLINSVNDYIPSYCNREFIKYYDTDKVEYFDATQSQYYPKEFPLISVTSLKYSSNEDGVYDTSLSEYTDYVIDRDNSRIIAVKTDYFIQATTPTNSGELTYKAGFSEVPQDILLAAVHLVEYFKEEGYTPRKSLAGTSVDNVIIPDKTARLPAHIRRTLEHHRAWNI